MVVDDTPANVRMLETRLAREGYEVITAHDGEQALAAAREQRPDLILLDIMMPKIDGIKVCREL
jgi:CheY-like chemotaxis protein